MMTNKLLLAVIARRYRAGKLTEMQMAQNQVSHTCVLVCRGDDSDDAKKPIPEWARGRALMQQLASQVQTDPDEVFQQHRKTCSLDEVFGHSGKPSFVCQVNQCF